MFKSYLQTCNFLAKIADVNQKYVIYLIHLDWMRFYLCVVVVVVSVRGMVDDIIAY